MLRRRLVMNVLRPHLVHAHRNAEAMTELARVLAVVHEGLDRVGRGLIAVSRDGRVRFSTRRVRQWVTAYFGGRPWSGDRLPEALHRWLRQQEARLAATGDAQRVRIPLVVERQDRRLVIRLVAEPGQYLLFLEEKLIGVRPRPLEPLGLTRREAEVLTWVADGKMNVEIAEILDIRRRTVSKHLEHIFEKLGVATRTAAAMRALELVRQGDAVDGSGSRQGR